MRLVLVSDTHNQHRKLKVPDGDVLLHAGDMTEMGLKPQIEAVGAWLRELPHRHKVVIAGNHDFLFQTNPGKAKVALGPGIHYLKDSGVEIDGIRFWGSPWQPWFYDWAFNLPIGPLLKAKWDRIPVNTDVLLTHGPPKGILDTTYSGNEVGCPDLRDRVLQGLKLKLHVFGHIHESYGQVRLEGYGADTLFVNAATDYCRREPVVIDL